ncbi:alcohol dehydrogenase [Micractinium conductrix]|uniref:Alcohol dehydrogenase n=1 Tax=Micractinium conductrix TaxID=554055 RepID=A0A2P6V1J6_9CHLO|nr:alcohol dehydrogenase [Micractinium conductrix]|eukprot:PSC67953.1 alcohol dehydrogenase [Micractinium conductrix]
MLAPASARLQAGGGSSTRMRPARCAAATLRMQAFKAESEKGAQVPLPVAAPVPGARGLAGYHHSPSKTGYAFFMPALSLLGPNALKAAGKEITKLGLKKALIVTDKVEEGLELLRSAGADFLLSFGGGSPHDCAKAIGIVASNGGSIRDYEGLDRASKPMLPLLSVNTTAGTAAEMTRFWESVSETNQSFCPWWFLLTCSIITDTARHVKMAIIDSKVTPTIAVDDPLLMLGMPKGLTAATGMDALTHSIEAYLSTSSNRITDACALHAMRLISRYLRTAVGDPGNVQAHDMMWQVGQLHYAQYLAGMAFNSASLGYVHAMAHQLGGFYNLPHGVCNALLLPVVLEFNAKASADARVGMLQWCMVSL